MNFSVFLELVEVTSLSASAFPLLFGAFYSYFRYGTINWINMILFFIAAVLFHMTTNINDNYWDYVNADDRADEFKRETNVIGVNKLNLKKVHIMNITFIAISGLIGLLLVFRTGLPLLWLGIFSFAVGILYAGGPKPINQTPYGEFFSGFTMGFIIILIAVYLNVATKIAFDWNFIWPILLVSGLTSFSISVLLLANGICDQQEDLALNRKTLVYYLGKKASLNLVVILYTLGFITLFISVILKFLPISTLLTILIIPVIYKNTKFLYHNQVKKEAFPKMAKTLAIIMLAEIISFGIGLLS